MRQKSENRTIPIRAPLRQRKAKQHTVANRSLSPKRKRMQRNQWTRIQQPNQRTRAPTQNHDAKLAEAKTKLMERIAKSMAEDKELWHQPNMLIFTAPCWKVFTVNKKDNSK